MRLAEILAAQAARVAKGWRQAVRMTVAALVAHAATQVLHLHQGQWAVITCLVVVQGTFANTLDASLSRAYGTVVGALGGILGVLALAGTGLPVAAALALAVAPMAALAATDPRFRLAPVTAGLVVLAASGGDAGIVVAFDRIAEILLGGVIGVAATLFILPERAEDSLVRHAAGALETLGAITRAHLLGGDIDPLHLAIEAAFVKAQTAAAEVAREQRVHLAKGAPPRPFMMALRRLRTDVALIERAMLLDDGPVDRSAAAAILGGWFDAAAAALRTGNALPEPPRLDAEAGGESAESFGAFGFALAALRRDQSNFCDRVDERIAAARP